MEEINISKGFKPRLMGIPDTSLITLPYPSTIGLSAMDVPYIRPKLLVKESDPVKTGTPLFTDKRDPSICFVSPATGIVKKIVFGERRRLMEIIISPDRLDDFVEFEPISEAGLAHISKQDLLERLKQGGLWQGLRQFPSKDTADSAHTPAMIIVSLNSNDIFSPHPGILIDREKKAFEMGLTLLRHFSDRIIVTARQSSLARLEPVKALITHWTSDTYPAWDPGVVLFHLKKNARENSAWCISAPHLVMMAKFLVTGRYPVEKIVTVTKPGDKKPHILIRQGAPIKTLAGRYPQESVITTGQFNGRIVDPQTHLGFFENTLNILSSRQEEELFGFIRPGMDKTTASKTFLSCLSPGPQQVDATLHGEERACINCSYCENICPNDLMPSFIMKALHSDEIENALELGLLDCCRCGLCAYTCPSKIELTKILCDGMDSHFKDKA